MKATVELELRPFTVPHGVSDKQECSFFTNTIPLSDLSPEILAALCEEFTQSVFEKAGKQRPPAAAVGVESLLPPKTKPPEGATHFTVAPTGGITFYRIVGKSINTWGAICSSWLPPLPDTISPTLTRIGQGDK